jgi:pimeloyl-ACP methyl ester carboxylesterase
VEFEYCLTPPAVKEDVTRNIKRFWEWLVDNLQSKLESLNKHFTVNWELYIFGASYGGALAIELWLESGSLVRKPPNFRVVAVLLESPATEEYVRDLGEYAGIQLSQQRVDEDSQRAFQVLDGMPWKIARPMALVPGWMYGGPLLAMSHRFPRLLKGKSTLELIKERRICPDESTRLFIRHGDKDVHIKPEVSLRLVEALRRWPVYIDFKVETGKGHVWGCNESLSKEKEEFFDNSWAK